MRTRPVPFRLPIAALMALPLFAACQRQAPPPEPEPKPAAAPPAPPPPIAPAVIDRAKLLQAIDSAAAAFAAGQADDAENIAGRRFSLRQAFGCRGPLAASAPGLARWNRSRDGGPIEVSLAPGDWTKDPLFTGVEPGWEAVEGFWIARPWLRKDRCPPAEAAPAPPAAEASGLPGIAKAPAPVLAQPIAGERQVAGLAAVFAEGGSRVGRRDGKPFAFTVRGEDDAPPAAPTGGYRLVLEGRLAAFPDGRAIRCRSVSPDVRPTCIAIAEIDLVAFEDADGKVLREWRPG